MATANFEIMVVTDVWVCKESDDRTHIWTDQDDVDHPLYECGDCGHIFSRRDTDSHQCPECNKFAQKISDYSCPEGCEEEMESVLAYEHEGSIYVPLEVARGEDA